MSSINWFIIIIATMIGIFTIGYIVWYNRLQNTVRDEANREIARLYSVLEILEKIREELDEGTSPVRKESFYITLSVMIHGLKEVNMFRLNKYAPIEADLVLTQHSHVKTLINQIRSIHFNETLKCRTNRSSAF